MLRIAMLTVWAFSSILTAQTPSILWTQSGQLPLENLGWVVALVGDIDGDGRGEVAASSPAHSSANGAVTMFRGDDGTVLWQTIGSADSTFGTSLACIGDADGDGIDDLIVGAPHDATTNQGAAHLVSGRTGQIVWTRPGGAVLPPLAYVQNFGFEVFRVGDIDGDGCADAWVVGGDVSASFGAILSGRDGTVLRIHNTTNSRWSPERACAIGDRDHDGYDDYAYGCPADNAPAFPWQYFGSVTIASGLTGQPFLIVEGDHVTSAFGRPAFGTSLDAFGDWNNDGVVDLIVGDPGWDYGMGTMFNAGRAQVVSGADGSILMTYGSQSGNRELGRRVFATGDVSGDGRGDFAVEGNLITTTALRTVQIMDGITGQVLQTLWPDPSINLTWGGAASGVDINGDRIPDLVQGVAWSPPIPGLPTNLNGLVFAFDLGFGGVRPLARSRGVGCWTSSGTLPQLRIESVPKLGQPVSLIGRALPATAPALLLLGAPQELELDALGAPDCTAYVDPGVLLGGSSSAGGYMQFDFAIPPIPALQGLALSAQWLAFDAGASSLGVVLSGAVDLELQ